MDVTVNIDIQTLSVDKFYHCPDYGQPLKEFIMATVDDVKAAIAAEAQQVSDRLNELQAQIVALQEQVANGSVATPEQLQELVDMVGGIFTPAPSA